MPRVDYVSQEEIDEEYEDLIVSTLQPGKRVNVYSAIGNNGPVLAGFREFLGSLWEHSGLTDRQREIVILTAASEIGSEYEWHQHVRFTRPSSKNSERKRRWEPPRLLRATSRSVA